MPGSETAPEGESGATVDDLLRSARILSEEYIDYRPPTVEQRIARALERRARDAAEGPTCATRTVAATPNHAAEHEQARHELDLTATLVLNSEQAAVYLQALDDVPPDDQGALVFGCLLYLTGRETAAQYWWRFAAGVGNPTAAFCLYLDHRRYAEYRDADFWRRQARRLRACPMPRAAVDDAESDARARNDVDAQSASGSAPGSAPGSASTRPLSDLRDLLAQCHSGRHPHLPLPLEGAVNRLPALPADAPQGFDEIPTSSPHLVTTLAICG